MTADPNYEEMEPATEQMEPRHGESAMLVLQRGAEASRVWPLSRTQPITIGRNDDCDIVLPDRQVSRYHARVEWHMDRYKVEDLGSKNGTHVNGHDVSEPIELQDGDEIQIALAFQDGVCRCRGDGAAVA